MADHTLMGGARSGKTAFGERLAMRAGSRPVYLATAEVLDEEMRARIEVHRQQRSNRFDLIEEPLDLVDALDRAAGEGHDVALVDCLTLWISNLLAAERDVTEEAETLAEFLGDTETMRVIIISNEVGLGIVPDNVLARTYRDLAGWTHQRLAERCAHVQFIVAGLPMTLKGDTPDLG